MTEQAQKLWGITRARPTPRPSPVLGLPHRQAGSSRQPSSNIDFEMLISRLHPFMPPSLGPKADSVRGKTAEPEREETQRTAGAPSFSPGRVPAGLFPEPSSDQSRRGKALLLPHLRGSPVLLSSCKCLSREEAASVTDGNNRTHHSF